ncbi:MAG: hypothetical protein IMZ70_07465 [Candidatus Atribacteria bacterium]|nr:hypothetical protein [Candidatus Atribacteria bacterium]MBE3138333.1 hypothetical protein [Actinomycetota bacterium]
MDGIRSLSGEGEDISFEIVDYGKIVTWGETKFKLPDSTINDILENFFIEADKWYPLGADMVSPMPGGLGVFIQSRYKDLSPRHASAIAALMYQEGFIDYKDGKPILLRKIKK